MLEENLIKIYETSFRENREMPALTDYFKGETFSYYEMAKEIAKLHLLFKKAGVKKGDKIALIGRNNPRWCITYIATISYGAVIVPILQVVSSSIRPDGHEAMAFAAMAMAFNPFSGSMPAWAAFP